VLPVPAVYDGSVVMFCFYWARIVSANESLKDEGQKMTLSVESFKRQLEKAYDKGREDEKDSRSADPYGALFNGMFGGR